MKFSLAASLLCLSAASGASAQSFQITIQGTAAGFNTLSDITAGTPYTLTFQSSLAGLTIFDQNAMSTFYTTVGSGQGGVTLQIAGRTYVAPDFQFYIHNDFFNPDYPQSPSIDAIDFGTVNYFEGEGLFFPSNGISIRFYSTNLSTLFSNTVEDFITASSYDPSLFAYDTTFGAVGFSNSNFSGPLSGVLGTYVSSITVTTAPVPEPASFAALMGITALGCVALRRRRKA